MQVDYLAFAYAIPLFAILGTYMTLRQRAQARTARMHGAAIEAGLNEPSSLHPKIDHSKCLGCGACVSACPEGQILGLVNGKAELIAASECIGHGACRVACPYDAISLVFGTETRGVDIPHVGEDFQTNVPGIFIAGELGGMGLVRNAIEQGRQAMEAIRRLGRLGRPGIFDVVIVGSGPAGISASLAASEHKLRYLTLEQDSLGGTVSHFPRGKLVMTQPATLPIVGKVKFKEIQKEDLISFWEKVVKEARLKIRYGERVQDVKNAGSHFEVITASGGYRARAVLLAIGRRGTPRRLDVAGEDQSKVVYRLVDPEQYRGKHVLVVGGGDSALEAAGSIALEPDTTVTLSYRSEAFSRAKPKNRALLDKGLAKGQLTVMLKSQILGIGPDSVELNWKGRKHRLKNDAVIICAGGILPTNFLKSMGVEIETKYATA
jgi:thioredoxin reductase (NADPH)